MQNKCSHEKDNCPDVTVQRGCISQNDHSYCITNPTDRATDSDSERPTSQVVPYLNCVASKEIFYLPGDNKNGNCLSVMEEHDRISVITTIKYNGIG